jgi:hypothetical protein
VAVQERAQPYLHAVTHPITRRHIQMRKLHASSLSRSLLRLRRRRRRLFR